MFMEMYLSLDLMKNMGFTLEDYWVLEAQRNADRFLTPEELAPIAGVTTKQAVRSVRRITEVMMLSNAFR